MDCNSLVFPIPTPTYKSNDYRGELVWIPKKEYSYKDKIKYCNRTMTMKKTLNYLNNGKLSFHTKSASMIQKIPSISFQFDNKFSESKHQEKIEYIPCLFIKEDTESDKIIIYFHSNYEDLGNTSKLCHTLAKHLHCNILSVEYPNYGIYESNTPTTSDTIIEDAEIVYKFLTEIQSINENNIILMGRCVGSGPTTYLAAKYHPSTLILLSPFKSIKEAVKTMFPKLNFGSFLQNFVKERFDNYSNIEKVKCPILFIHGKKDTVIPYTHSIDLINQCQSFAKLNSPDEMTHSSFDFYKDVVLNIKDFIKLFENLNDASNFDELETESFPVSFPICMFECPNVINNIG